MYTKFIKKINSNGEDQKYEIIKGKYTNHYIYCFDQDNIAIMKIKNGSKHGRTHQANYKLLYKGKKYFSFQGSIDEDGQFMTNKHESNGKRNGVRISDTRLI